MNGRLELTHRTKATSTVGAAVIRFLLVGAVALLAIAPAIAQETQLQEKMSAVTQIAAANKQRLQQYQWIELTQMTLDGDQKPATQNLCRYAPDGSVQKTPLGAPPPPPSGGRLKERIIEKKKAEMEQYMASVKAVLSLYVPPDPQALGQAYQAGKVTLQPSNGVVNLIFSNYAQPGDKMTLTYNAGAHAITSLSVNTYFDQTKDDVTLQVQMATLPDGTNYVQQTVLNATAKKLVVTTTSSSFQLINQ